MARVLSEPIRNVVAVSSCFRSAVENGYFCEHKRLAKYLPSSQRSPLNPFLQLQRNPPSVLMQVPPFLHGLLEHSFTSKPIMEHSQEKSELLYHNRHGVVITAIIQTPVH